MNFEKVERQIVQRLQEKIIDTDVKFFTMPEYDDDDQTKWPFRERWLIAAFTGEEPDKDPDDTGMMVQHTDVTFTVLIKGKTLYGSSGIYGLEHQVKKAIVGLRAIDGDKFRYAGFKFVDRSNSVFMYAVDFRTRAIVQEEIEEEEGPFFTQLTIKE